MRNLAVVEAAEVAFGPGFNVITGETGAGKSVLLGALRLLFGGRAERGQIRTGAAEAIVCGEFELSGEALAEVNRLLEEAGVDGCEGGGLVIRRWISAEGSGKVRVNACPATAGLLKRLAPWLADLHGPNDQAALLEERFQLALLTAYAGAEAEAEAYRTAWETLRAHTRALEALAGAPGEREAEQARLEDLLEEFERVCPTEEDGDALTERHAQAANAEEILALGNGLTDALTDGEEPIAEALSGVQRGLRELARLLPEAGEWGNELSGIQVQLQELSRTMAERLSRVEADPEALAALEVRLGQIQRLRRKYGPSLPEVLETWQRMKARLEALAGAEGEIARLERAVAEDRAAAEQAGLALRAKRTAGAEGLARAITAELRDLGFLQSAFSVRLTPREAGPQGLDGVSFCFAPNPGEGAKALAEIASSGEIARVMLAAKAILARHGRVPTLVFDEIDANVGGETARKVGEKLCALGRWAQVLCITHQPQAAAFGQSHFRVEKHVAEGRTQTTIRRLDEAERSAELARMLGGGAAAEAHAAALLG